MIDIWSLGIVLLELHLGDNIIISENEYDHIYQICFLLGMPKEE